jgi:hypothetical protein
MLGLVKRRLATVTSMVAIAAFCSGLSASASSAAPYGPDSFKRVLSHLAEFF